MSLPAAFDEARNPLHKQSHQEGLDWLIAGDSVLDHHFTLPLVLRRGPKHWILSVDDGDLHVVLVGLATMKSHAVLHKLLWRIANLI